MRVQTSRQAAVAAFALLLAAGSVSRGFAQTTYGSIVGTARDASGGVVSTGGPDRSPGPSFVSEGNRYTGNSFLIGGINTRTQREGGYGVSISVDAVGEFKILQNAFAAEYGRGTTIVNATIKSGSNEFHGAVFEFLRNQKLDARYSYNFTNTKSPLRQNQFGTSVGGPIIHNKTFFFLNYEGERVRRGSIGYTNMPAQAQLGGDLSSMSQIARDPDTGVAFPGNIVPANRITQF